MIHKRPEYYSAAGSVFNVRLKNDKRIIQHLVQDSAYDSKTIRVLFSNWFRIQPKRLSVLKRIDAHVTSGPCCLYMPRKYIVHGSNLIYLSDITGLRYAKTCLRAYADTEDLDQCAHPRSLNRDFTVC